MKQRSIPLFALTLNLLSLIGCANTPQNLAATEDDRIYVTGSNIPRKERPKGAVTEMSKEDLDRLRQPLPTNLPQQTR